MRNTKDIAEKKLEDYPDVFADIFNVLLFKEDFIKPEQLESGPTASIYKAKNLSRVQDRDILKYYRGIGMNITSFGIENQSKIDKNMPVRVMGYDYGSYRLQIDSKSNQVPVVTLVLNFSGEKWTAPKELSGMFKIPEKIKPFFQDYHIHVIDICDLDQTTISRFNSDFKSIAAFFKYGAGYMSHSDSTEKLKHVDAVVELLSTFNKNANQAELEKIVNNQNGGITMCDIIKEIKEEGKLTTLINLVNKKLLSSDIAATEAGMSKEEFEKLVNSKTNNV